MKRIAIADIHFTGYDNDPVEPGDEYPKRLQQIYDSLVKVCEYARANRILYVDILGDLCHDKYIVYTNAQNCLKRVILDYSDIMFTILSGNHDESSKGENSTSTIEVFSAYSNVRCYYATKSAKYYTLDNITIVPYSEDLKTALVECEETDILLSHFGVNEAVLQSGISVRTNISFSMLASKFKLTLLGHYHKPQEMKDGANRSLWYPGSFISCSWNDKNETKRFLVYDTETLEVTPVEMSWGVQYKEYVITDANDFVSVTERAKRDKENGHHVRIVNTSKELQKVLQENNQTSDAIAANDLTVVDKCEQDIVERGLSSGMAEEDIFKKYLSVKGIPDEKHTKYMNYLTSVLHQEEPENSATGLVVL